ncbi:MAG: 5-amino-6-(D-ribitylamino)uracil--L-tyrosine 4-hydroxyphenyl transferase CofH [Acidobacteria bacterium]|nr:5-amino-6-(D-ribitylamino)uracil--L-tyrosine 4-hydroxyphenyl transferase CofH [Acidobacteriota bacterium]
MSPALSTFLERRPTPVEARALAAVDAGSGLDELIEVAGELRDRGHGDLVSYSRKVFLPLTHLCRDICHYCVFARPPKKGEAAYMPLDNVLSQARLAAAAGCKEALFTLGDKPEFRYKAAREGLAELGHDTTLSYLREAAERVLIETGLLPHLNPGLMTAADIEHLRPVAPSMGIMLESVSTRLHEKGQAHYGCPDKVPERRLETLRLAGEARVPFTSGILIGIGETREERIDALLALRELHGEYGHIQEVIIQNFRAKPETRMADAPEPTLEDLLWTIASARLVLGPRMHIQAPPNLSPGVLPRLVAAGIDDWGGVSPVTPDFVNPEAPWPHLERLAEETAAAGKTLIERLTVYPEWALDGETWLDDGRGQSREIRRLGGVRTAVLQRIDATGLPRTDDWSPGEQTPPPRDVLDAVTAAPSRNGNGHTLASPPIRTLLDWAQAGEDLNEEQITTLFEARGSDFSAVCAAADAVRREVNGDTVTYVVNRNINYTNVCYFKCQFCAFSKGKLSENLRGKPYDLELEEVMRRTVEAWQRGATEVCMQGGIHPDYTGETYLGICRAVKEAVPEIHVHAFSPLEVWQGAATLDTPLKDYLLLLKVAGLGTLPGTAAEILDDEVRAVICPDKLNTDQWLEVMETAHGVGYRTTATIMYGHVDGPRNWARHLLRLRDLQKRTRGFTEFVPLPFVHMEAPLYLKGRARKGPTFREAVLMHAVARLALHPWFENVQASWVKMGPEGVAACLNAGVNDLGGTLMNESITRAAGAEHGQELPPSEMEALIRELGRIPRQRTTAYGTPPPERVEASFQAAELAAVLNTPAHRYERTGPLQLVRPGLEADGS